MANIVIEESTELRRFAPYPMPAPWRIEAKSSPFHPWIIVEPTVHRLERAITHADEMKKAFRYYATRIRAN